MKLAHHTELTLKQLQMLWRAENRHAVTEVAERFGVSRVFVDKVFRGEMRSGERRVERRLAELGCPGFEDYIQSASTIGEVSSQVNGPDGR